MNGLFEKPPVYVHFQNFQTKRYLESTSKGVVRTSNEYKDEDSQYWQMIKTVGKDKYILKNKQTNENLDTNLDGRVFMRLNNGRIKQRWLVKNNKIQSVHSGRVLDSNSNGHVYALFDNGGDYQKWTFE